MNTHMFFSHITHLLFLRYLISATLLSLPFASQAGINCDANLTPVETMICKDNWLLELDGRLNSSFESALKVTPNKPALVHEQREWLKTKRNKCSNRDCLNLAYTTRVEVLDLIKLLWLDIYQVKSQGILESDLSNNDAAGICSSLASLSDEGNLTRLSIHGQEQWTSNSEDIPDGWKLTEVEKNNFGSPSIVYRLQLKNKGESVRFGTIQNGGSCGNEQFFNLSFSSETWGNNGIEKVDDPNDEIRWTRFGGYEYPIYYKGRYFLITDNFRARAPTMISWVKPNGKTRPLCLLSIENRERIVSSAKNEKFCLSVAKGVVKPLKWENIAAKIPLSTNSPNYREEFVTRYQNYADKISLLRLDINGDGKSENVGHLTYNSEAGCGSTRQWLSVLADDLGKVETNLLNEIFGKLDDSSHLYIYQDGNRYYIDASTDSSGEGVLHIQGNQIEQTCSFKIKNHTKVSRLFDVSPAK
jgi:uncharacterized protein